VTDSCWHPISHADILYVWWTLPRLPLVSGISQDRKKFTASEVMEQATIGAPFNPDFGISPWMNARRWKCSECLKTHARHHQTYNHIKRCHPEVEFPAPVLLSINKGEYISRVDFGY
jgi:hypothetical protein